VLPDECMLGRMTSLKEVGNNWRRQSTLIIYWIFILRLAALEPTPVGSVMQPETAAIKLLVMFVKENRWTNISMNLDFNTKQVSRVI